MHTAAHTAKFTKYIAHEQTKTNSPVARIEYNTLHERVNYSIMQQQAGMQHFGCTQ